MKFARWLNHLTGLDFLIIFTLFAIACGLSYLTLRFLKNWYRKMHQGNPYRHDFRMTPFSLVGIATLYALILYRTLGLLVTDWIRAQIH